MSIEYKFQSVVLQSEDIEKQFPGLASMVNSYLPKKKKYKRKKKNRITVGNLIDEILADIQVE